MSVGGKRLTRLVAGFLLLDLILFANFLPPLLGQRLSPTWGMVLVLPLAAGLLVLFFAAARYLERAGVAPSGTGLARQAGWGRHLGAGFLVGAVWLVLLYAARWHFAGWRVTVVHPMGEWLVPQLCYALVWFGISLQEEYLIRWYALKRLNDRYRLPIALTLSSVIYFAHHYHFWGRGVGPWMLWLFTLGLALAISVARTGSLWFAIGFHTMWNIGVTWVEGFLGPGIVQTTTANSALSTWLGIGAAVLMVVAIHLVMKSPAPGHEAERRPA